MSNIEQIQFEIKTLQQMRQSKRKSAQERNILDRMIAALEAKLVEVNA